MKKSVGIIIGVIVAVVAIVLGVVFLGPDKDTSKENPSENVSQNDAVALDEMLMGQTGVITYDQDIMDNTIDLTAIDIATEFNIAGDYEISVPYPTSFGCVYVVKEYLIEKTLTYIFVTTQDDVMYKMVTDFDSPGHTLENYMGATYELRTANVDNEPGEEIIFLMPVGSTAGRGAWVTCVYKITENGIKDMDFEEDGYNVSSEKPFKFHITNKYTDLDYTVEADKDSYFFESDGTPATEYERDFYSLRWYARPVDVDNDGVCEIEVKAWNYISKETEKNVDFVTIYDYNEDKEEFVVVNTDVMLSDDEDDVYDDDYNYYTYCDINNDGVDEFITQTTAETESEAFPYVTRYSVYTFTEDNKLVFAGATAHRPGYLYNSGNKLVEAGMRTSMLFYNAYELKDNKLVLVDSGKDISMEYEDEMYEKLGDELAWKFY